MKNLNNANEKERVEDSLKHDEELILDNSNNLNNNSLNLLEKRNERLICKY